MNLDRFQELTGREEADIELCEHICDLCGKDAIDICPYTDINDCKAIQDRHEYYGE